MGNSFLNTSLLFHGVSVLFLWPKTTFLFGGKVWGARPPALQDKLGEKKVI